MTVLGEYLPILIIFIYPFIGLYLVVTRKTRLNRIQLKNHSGRRIYFYCISFIGIIMFANGSIQLIDYLILKLTSNTLLSIEPEQLAAGISLLLVGVPIWFFHWHFINAQIRKDPSEGTSEVRVFYLFLICSISISLVSKNLFVFLNFILDTRPINYSSVCSVLIWGTLWALHWNEIKRDKKSFNSATQFLINETYIYIISYIGLILMAIGTGAIINTIFQETYVTFASTQIFNLNDNSLFWQSIKRNLALVLLGILLWGYHWYFLSVKSKKGSIGKFYSYAICILIGGIPVIISMIGIIQSLFKFSFYSLPFFLALGFVSSCIFYYHVVYIRNKNIYYEVNQSTRIFLYSFLFISLFTVFIGLILLSNSSISILLISLKYNQNSLLYNHSNVLGFIFDSVSMLLIGGSIWVFCLSRINSRIKTGLDIQSSIRKIYFTSVLGIVITIAALASTSLLFITILQLLKNGDTIESITLPLSILISIVLIAPYHYKRYGMENLKSKHSSKISSNPKIITILSRSSDRLFINEIEKLLGYKVNAVQWNNEGVNRINTHKINVDELVTVITQENGPNVLIIPDINGVKVYSHSGTIHLE